MVSSLKVVSEFRVVSSFVFCVVFSRPSFVFFGHWVLTIVLSVIRFPATGHLKEFYSALSHLITFLLLEG
jgi:hypothetical protein